MFRALMKGYQDIDFILLKQIMKILSMDLKVTGGPVLEKIDCLDCFVDMDALDVWYDNAWWGILYNVPILEELPFENVKTYKDKKIQGFFMIYRWLIVNYLRLDCG